MTPEEIERLYRAMKAAEREMEAARDRLVDASRVFYHKERAHRAARKSWEAAKATRKADA